MEFILPKKDQTFMPGQCIPLKITGLPKVEGGAVTVSIYPFPVISGVFEVKDGTVDIECLTEFPYNYSLLGPGNSKYTPEQDMVIEVDGAGSLFGQVAGVQPIRYVETMPKYVYLKVDAKKDITIRVYGWDRSSIFSLLNTKKIKAGTVGYVKILEGNLFEDPQGYAYTVVYKDSVDDPYIAKGPNELVKKIETDSYTIEVVTSKPETEKPYYVVYFYNKTKYTVYVFYQDYFFGYTVGEIQPDGMDVMFVDKNNDTLYPSIQYGSLNIPCSPITVTENENIEFTQEDAKQCLSIL